MDAEQAIRRMAVILSEGFCPICLTPFQDRMGNGSLVCEAGLTAIQVRIVMAHELGINLDQCGTR